LPSIVIAFSIDAKQLKADVKLTLDRQWIEVQKASTVIGQLPDKFQDVDLHFWIVSGQQTGEQFFEDGT